MRSVPRCVCILNTDLLSQRVGSEKLRHVEKKRVIVTSCCKIMERASVQVPLVTSVTNKSDKLCLTKNT